MWINVLAQLSHMINWLILAVFCPGETESMWMIVYENTPAGIRVAKSCPSLSTTAS